jgi:small conductance mechanosensitive channel
MDTFFTKGKDFLSDLIFVHGTKIIIALIVLWIGWKLINVFAKMLKKVFVKREVDSSLQDFLITLITIALRILLILTVMGMMGIAMTSFIALIGAAGLAIGMALQGTLQNFAGGIIILILKPFKVGDWIEQGAFSGEVKKIQIFNTYLATGDNKVIILPNTQLATQPLINYTRSQIRRIDISCSIAYGESVEKARKVLLDIASQYNEFLSEPSKPLVHVMTLSDSSVDLQLRGWVNTNDYWTVLFSLNQAVYDRFNAENIEIPYKQLDVHIKQN